MANYVADIVTNELDKRGLDYRLSHRSKHLQLQFVAAGRSYIYILPHTSSDWRAAHNARADVRRMLRQAGAVS